MQIDKIIANGKSFLAPVNFGIERVQRLFGLLVSALVPCQHHLFDLLHGGMHIGHYFQHLSLNLLPLLDKINHFLQLLRQLSRAGSVLETGKTAVYDAYYFCRRLSSWYSTARFFTEVSAFSASATIALALSSRSFFSYSQNTN